MRGAVPQWLSILALFLGVSLISMLIECISPQSLNLDVPQCSSYSQCYKIARIEGSESYSAFVAHAWYHANRARTALTAVYDICTLNLEDKNIADIPKLVFQAMRSAESPAALAVLYTDKSVHAAVQEIALTVDELERGGARFSKEPEISYYQSVFFQTLEGIRDEKNTTTITEKILKYKRGMAPFVSLLSNMFLASAYAIPYVGKMLKWSSLRLSSVYALGSALEKMSDIAFPEEPDIINAGVGRRESVWATLSPTLADYHHLRSAMDERVRKNLVSAGKIKAEILDLTSELRSYDLSALTPDVVSRFAPRKTEKTVVSTPLPEVANAYSLEAKKSYASLVYHSQAFLSRESNFFVHYDSALGEYKRLTAMRDELKKLLSDLDSLASSCADYLSSYSKRAKSDTVKVLLPGIAETVRKNKDFHECARGIRLVLLDENYASEEAMLRACEKRISCHDDYYCAGDVSTCLSYCLNFAEQKRTELTSSQKYGQYLELRSSILSILSRCPDAELEARLVSLPDSFLCWNELDKAISESLSLYKKAKKIGERCMQPNIAYDGYFDADEASKVYIDLSIDAGKADLDLTIDLPFDVITYWVERADRLVVTVSKSKAYLHGSGSARLGILAHPVPLKEEIIGVDGEYRVIRYSNETGLPVRKRIYGNVVATAGSVYWDGNYIYFDGYGSAVVEIRALSVDYVREGDRVLVDVVNTTPEEFSGSILVPYGVESAPSYCTKYDDFTVCRVNIDPFERRSFELKGIRNDLNVYSDALKDIVPENEVAVFSSEPPETSVSSAILRVTKSSDMNGVLSLRSDIEETLSTLYGYLHRAEDLNVLSLLPYTEKTLDNVRELISDTNDTLVLSTVLSVLHDQERSVRSRASSLVHSLARFAPEDDATKLAKSALSSGDYVLAMAVAYSSLPKNVSPSHSFPLLSVVLALLSLVTLTYYIKRTYRTPRKRKRIPKI